MQNNSKIKFHIPQAIDLLAGDTWPVVMSRVLNWLPINIRHQIGPDCMPVLGKSETSNDIFFAFGGQHIGLTIGPKMGRIITNLILDKKQNVSLAQFRNERFYKSLMKRLGVRIPLINIKS